jgi:Domain of unknown function (DUF4394)
MIPTRIRAGRLALLLTAALGTLAAGQADAACPPDGLPVMTSQRVFALTDGDALISVRACDGGAARFAGTVSGLTGSDTTLVGIDFRVQDGLLYGVGNAGGIYTLDTTTAAATKVSQLSVALDGTLFGVDFNPAANALRIVSNTGQNLRHPFATPEPRTTLVDLALNYTAGTPVSGVVSAAYTNNDLDTKTGTTLFNIDGNLKQVVLQAPPNNGTLAATGQLGVSPVGAVGFDILSVFGPAGVRNNLGFASMTVDSTSALYGINLLTGAATRLGTLPATVKDIAVPLAAAPGAR